MSDYAALSGPYVARRFGTSTVDSVELELVDDFADDEAPPRFRTLSDYYTRPELLRPPPETIPRLAFAGRSTLIAAPEKAGKSTLVRSAVEAVAKGGSFLGAAAAQGRTLWLALDEPVGDLVRGLHELDVPGDAVVICETRPTIVELAAAMADVQPIVMVVDCLTGYAEGEVQNSYAATEWQVLLRPLNALLRKHDCAGLIIHHTVRDGSRYADSRHIGAAVDCILEMSMADTDDTVRKVKTRGRIRSERFSLRYTQGRYELESGELTLEMKVYRAIEARPGASTSKVREAVGGKASLVDAAISDLTFKGVIEDHGNKNARAYHVKSPVSGTGPGQGGDWVPEELLSDAGQGGTGPGQGSGLAPLSHPLKRVGGTGYEEGDPCTTCNTPLRRTSRGMWRCPECCPDNKWTVA